MASRQTLITLDFAMDMEAVKQPLYQTDVASIQQSHIHALVQAQSHKQEQVIIGLSFMWGHE